MQERFSGCCCLFCDGRLGPSIRLSILERFFHLFQHQGSHQSREREALKATFWTLLLNFTAHNEFLSRSCPHKSNRRKKKKSSRHLYFCWRRKKNNLKAKSFFFFSFLVKKKHLVGKAKDLRNKCWGMCEFLFFFHSFFFHSAMSEAQDTRRLICHLKRCLEMDFVTLAPIIFIFMFSNLLTTVEFFIYFINQVRFRTLRSIKMERGGKYVQVKANLKQRVTTEGREGTAGIVNALAWSVSSFPNELSNNRCTCEEYLPCRFAPAGEMTVWRQTGSMQTHAGPATGERFKTALSHPEKVPSAPLKLGQSLSNTSPIKSLNNDFV